MPQKRKYLTPKEFEDFTKHMFRLEHEKGYGTLRTNGTEEQISKGISIIFSDIDKL